MNKHEWIWLGRGWFCPRCKAYASEGAALPIQGCIR